MARAGKRGTTIKTKPHLNICLPARLKQLIALKAAENNRSLNTEIVKILGYYFEPAGNIIKEPQTKKLKQNPTPFIKRVLRAFIPKFKTTKTQNKNGEFVRSKDIKSVPLRMQPDLKTFVEQRATAKGISRNAQLNEMLILAKDNKYE